MMRYLFLLVTLHQGMLAMEFKPEEKTQSIEEEKAKESAQEEKLKHEEQKEEQFKSATSQLSSQPKTQSLQQEQKPSISSLPQSLEQATAPEQITQENISPTSSTVSMSALFVSTPEPAKQLQSVEDVRQAILKLSSKPYPAVAEFKGLIEELENIKNDSTRSKNFDTKRLNDQIETLKMKSDMRVKEENPTNLRDLNTLISKAKENIKKLESPALKFGADELKATALDSANNELTRLTELRDKMAKTLVQKDVSFISSMKEGKEIKPMDAEIMEKQLVDYIPGRGLQYGGNPSPFAESIGGVGDSIRTIELQPEELRAEMIIQVTAEIEKAQDALNQIERIVLQKIKNNPHSEKFATTGITELGVINDYQNFLDRSKQRAEALRDGKITPIIELSSEDNAAIEQNRNSEIKKSNWAKEVLEGWSKKPANKGQSFSNDKRKELRGEINKLRLDNNVRKMVQERDALYKERAAYENAFNELKQKEGGGQFAREHGVTGELPSARAERWIRALDEAIIDLDNEINFEQERQRPINEEAETFGNIAAESIIDYPEKSFFKIYREKINTSVEKLKNTLASESSWKDKKEAYETLRLSLEREKEIVSKATGRQLEAEQSDNNREKYKKLIKDDKQMPSKRLGEYGTFIDAQLKLVKDRYRKAEAKAKES
ncbi:MAG: hypothetical protein WCE21_00440 [Candidatus Babeliales bacterium]